ncbi:condensation domain-containing protein [Bradyrhizobium cytisi]
MRPGRAEAMVSYPDLSCEYPCSWDQNERLTSARAQTKERDKVAKAWFVDDNTRLEDIAAAWREVIVRHPSLRVAFTQHRQGYWTQRVLPCEAVESWCTVVEEATEEQLSTLRAHVGLHTGQLFSVALVRRTNGLEVHFTVDHICIDSRSLTVIVDEWSRFIDNGPPTVREVDDKFLRFCLKRAPSPEVLRQTLEEEARAPAKSFPPYAQAPLSLSENAGRYQLEAAKVKIPWTGFSFDARTCAAGIGPALLASGLDSLHGTQPGLTTEYPMIGVLLGRNSLEYDQSVGPFSSWFMLSVPVGPDGLATRARKVHGRLLNAVRRPPTPFALETAIRVNNLVAARNRPYHQSPRYLYANHLMPTRDLTVSGKAARAIALDGGLRGYGLARALSRSWEDGLELEFTARADLLSTGVTEYLVRHALEQSRSEAMATVEAR